LGIGAADFSGVSDYVGTVRGRRSCPCGERRPLSTAAVGQSASVDRKARRSPPSLSPPSAALPGKEKIRSRPERPSPRTGERNSCYVQRKSGQTGQRTGQKEQTTGQNARQSGQNARQSGQNPRQTGQITRRDGQKRQKRSQKPRGSGPELRKRSQRAWKKRQGPRRRDQNPQQIGQNLQRIGQNPQRIGQGLRGGDRECSGPAGGPDEPGRRRCRPFSGRRSGSGGRRVLRRSGCRFRSHRRIVRGVDRFVRTFH
jgi:hypothetical protein